MTTTVPERRQTIAAKLWARIGRTCIRTGTNTLCPALLVVCQALTVRKIMYAHLRIFLLLLGLAVDRATVVATLDTLSLLIAAIAVVAETVGDTVDTGLGGIGMRVGSASMAAAAHADIPLFLVVGHAVAVAKAGDALLVGTGNRKHGTGKDAAVAHADLALFVKGLVAEAIVRSHDAFLAGIGMAVRSATKAAFENTGIVYLVEALVTTAIVHGTETVATALGTSVLGTGKGTDFRWWRRGRHYRRRRFHASSLVFDVSRLALAIVDALGASFGIDWFRVARTYIETLEDWCQGQFRKRERFR